MGNPPDIIDVPGDSSYNIPLYSGVGKTPFQPATQVCYLQAENVTSKNDVIALTTENRLCSHHIQHQSEEINMTNKTCDCTANLSMETNIDDEETWTSKCLLNLKEDNFEIQAAIGLQSNFTMKGSLILSLKTLSTPDISLKTIGSI
ncbi:hypothetical protein CHS0354_004788 [Potamilus streckersoni]|uniref:Uncharacterized protein n=1 Tax=Potamilus streckersoni TaxID=2493646 RepID=A0AAE0WCB2_9BIVA|nr:hypothetical protein CHS0354_004788 [Potamilus streckersoni]